MLQFRSVSGFASFPVALAAIGFLSPSHVSAQGPVFDSPGQSKYSQLGQTTRFSTEFNPAIGFVIDSYADWTDPADSGEDSGLDLSVRLLEFNAAAYVDPNVWAYVVLVAEDLEELGVEEAAIEYVGSDSNATFKAGRFFVDFGKQMQMHLEELRTLERPLALREYLGVELAGTGLQGDWWTPVGDATVVRVSFGAFASLLGEGHHHEEEGEGDEPETAVPDRKDFDELSFTARVTGMRDIGRSGVLQLGASARVVPEFSAEFDTLEQTGLSNTVYGADATYGWTDATGERSLTLGGEALMFSGDLAVEVDDPVTPTALDVVDDDAFGYYAFADYAWNRYDSAGVQYSLADLAEDPTEDASELDLYYTRHLTEFRRLRFGVTLGDGVEADTRAYIQFTNYFGSHAHGLNW